MQSSEKLRQKLIFSGYRSSFWNAETFHYGNVNTSVEETKRNPYVLCCIYDLCITYASETWKVLWFHWIITFLNVAYYNLKYFELIIESGVSDLITHLCEYGAVMSIFFLKLFFSADQAFGYFWQHLQGICMTNVSLWNLCKIKVMLTSFRFTEVWNRNCMITLYIRTKNKKKKQNEELLLNPLLSMVSAQNNSSFFTSYSI